MENIVFEKEYFGKTFKFLQIDELVNQYFNQLKSENLNLNSISIKSNDENIENIEFLKNENDLLGLRLNNYCYSNLDALKFLPNLRYLEFIGKCKTLVPFSYLKNLWCIYLNYDKKNTNEIFRCQNLEYIFIDNYSELNSEKFEIFRKAKRIGLVKSKISEFKAINRMPNLEHIGIGYNLNMKSINWLENNKSLKSVGFQNCKNISDWDCLGTLCNLEKIIIDNCGNIESLDFLENCKNLLEVRILGSTSIQDGKLKWLLKKQTLKFFFIPVKKEYDISLAEITSFNKR